MTNLKASIEFIEQLEILLDLYEKEVNEKRNKSILEEKTAKTYLRHASTFVRWCKDDFTPGVNKLKK